MCTENRLTRSLRLKILSPLVILREEIYELDYLGVRWDKHLNWNEQITKLAVTLAKNLFVL